ncbi:helix-turn-helix transcriptional regulator [Bacillus tianshenii]|nr:helix-turn-helix transcriptional regulator [Bacillus tianshenii]
MELKIRINLDKVLKERKMKQKELNDLIEQKFGENKRLRPATISEICNNQRSTINKEHIELIASALEIKDVTKLLSFEETSS